MILPDSRTVAKVLLLGGISTIAAGIGMVFILNPVVGSIVIATSLLEFVAAAFLWRSSRSC